MKILIVKTSALGDVVHSLPVLAYLKSADPLVEIDWLIEENLTPLLAGHPCVRRVYPIATRRWRRQSFFQKGREVLAIAGRLKKEKYDLVLDLQGNAKSGLFTLLTGCPKRYGLARDWVREWPNLLATNRRVAPKDVVHISDISLAVAKAGLPGGTAMRAAGPLPIPVGPLREVNEWLSEQGLSDRRLVVLHCGTTWSTKLWGLPAWREFASKLASEEKVGLVLTWGNETERSAAATVREVCGGHAALWPRSSLPQLIALLARANLVIGGDTGPVHIAAAVGTPTLSFYRATDADRNGPRGEMHIRLQSPMACSPCLLKKCDRDDSCALSISVADALGAARFVLGRGEPLLAAKQLNEQQ